MPVAFSPLILFVGASCVEQKLENSPVFFGIQHNYVSDCFIINLFIIYSAFLLYIFLPLSRSSSTCNAVLEAASKYNSPVMIQGECVFVVRKRRWHAFLFFARQLEWNAMSWKKFSSLTAV